MYRQALKKWRDQCRVARFFQTKNPNFVKFWKALVDWKTLMYFMAIWNILRTFVIFYDDLESFVFIWNIFHVLVSRTNKNLATLDQWTADEIGPPGVAVVRLKLRTL
jgi:hypothetical protein